MRTRFLVLLLLLVFSRLEAKPEGRSVVRVNVSSQAYDFFRPWTKRAPFSREALGVLLPNDRILVTAELVANANYIELETGGQKAGATVDVVDYAANLALLKPSDPKFTGDLKPMEIGNGSVGDRLSVWQLERNDVLLETNAVITTIEVGRYPIDDIALLVYRVTAPLQYREGSFTLPLVKDNKLSGMLMRYDSRAQNADVVPAPVIEHFLKDAASGAYRGFPRTGLQFSATRDPQLRKYVGLGNEVSGGVYISHVAKGGPAEQAGIRRGDILLTAKGYSIDHNGHYIDPVFGSLSLVHLFTTQHFDGDEVPLELLRGGRPVSLKVKVSCRAADQMIIEPFVIDKAPSYYVLGGLILQELSRQYLKEWGDMKKAPARFVYYDRYQSELFANDPRKRLVILSQVLPSKITMGYEEVGQVAVTKINNVPILSLADVEKAVARPLNGFHKIELEEHPRVIYLDAEQVRSQEELLKRAYGLASIKGGPAFE